MAKYRDSLLDEVVDWIAEHGLIERGGAPLNQFVAHFGISDQCYRKWLRGKPQFVEAIDKGRELFLRNAATTLVRSLFESAKGGYHEETTETEDTRYVPNPADSTKPTIKEMVKRKTKTNKWSPPNTGAAIFLLTNLDPEGWQNRQKQDVTVKQNDSEETMSLDAIEAELARLNKLDKTEEEPKGNKKED